MFRRVVAVLVVGALVFFDALAQQPLRQEVIVRKGAVLKLSTLQLLDSATARPGDDVPLRLSRPLVVDGVTLLPDGEVLHGRVTRVKRAGNHCENGLVEWKLDRVAFDDHTTARSMMYYPARNVEVPEHIPPSLASEESAFDRVGVPILAGIFYVPALVFISPYALLNAPSAAHSKSCDTPGTEFQVPPGTTVAVVITRNHHVRL